MLQYSEKAGLQFVVAYNLLIGRCSYDKGVRHRQPRRKKSRERGAFSTGERQLSRPSIGQTQHVLVVNHPSALVRNFSRVRWAGAR